MITQTIILLEEMGGIHLGGMWDGKSSDGINSENSSEFLAGH